MLLWVLCITSITLLETTHGDVALPSFHREVPKDAEITENPGLNNHDQLTQEKSKQTDSVGEMLIPHTKPQKIFPKPNDQNHTVNIYYVDNSQKSIKNDKSKSQFSKNESGKVVSVTEKDVNKKLDNAKTNRNVDKLTMNKSESTTNISISDDVSSHEMPHLKFPKDKAINASEPVHGHRIPDPAEKLPLNSSLPAKDIEPLTTVVPNVPVSVLPTTSKPLVPQNSTEHIEHIDNVPKDEKKDPSEAKDMNSKKKYSGECDVDQINPVAIATSLEKCVPKINSTENTKETPESSTIPGQHPESEILPGFNKSGPHSIPEEKGLKQLDVNDSRGKQQSVHINSDKVSEKIVMGLTEENHKESSAFRAAGNGVTIFVISLATLALFGYVGLVVWRKVMLRRSGREILINEDEFCEDCPDSQLEMNQQNNRNIII